MLLRKFKRHPLLLIWAAAFFALGNAVHPLLHDHGSRSGSPERVAEAETAARLDAAQPREALLAHSTSFCPVCSGLFQLAAAPDPAPEISLADGRTALVPVAAAMPPSAVAASNSRGPPAGL